MNGCPRQNPAYRPTPSSLPYRDYLLDSVLVQPRCSIRDPLAQPPPFSCTPELLIFRLRFAHPSPVLCATVRRTCLSTLNRRQFAAETFLALVLTKVA